MTPKTQKKVFALLDKFDSKMPKLMPGCTFVEFKYSRKDNNGSIKTELFTIKFLNRFFLIQPQPDFIFGQIRLQMKNGEYFGKYGNAMPAALEALYELKEITKAEYLEVKQELDFIRNGPKIKELEKQAKALGVKVVRC